MEQKQSHATADYLDYISSDEAFETAKAEGLLIALPKSNQLQIDIDDKKSMYLFDERLETFKNWFVVDSITKTRSRSKKDGYHIVLNLATVVSPMERIFCQLFLGSDSTREWLSFQRILAGDPNPTLFFERR